MSVKLSDITPEDFEKAQKLAPEIRAFIAGFPMHKGVSLTTQMAIWHLKTVESLESQIENMRNEITGKC